MISDESVALNRAYFDAKAERFHSAFESAPAARTLELLPLLFFLGNCSRKKSWREAVAADLLCGDGHFVKGLDGCFRHVHGVDLSPGLLGYFPKTATTTATITALDESSEILKSKIKPDAIISVAGLHHIYSMKNGAVDPALSDARQVEVLANWMNCLPKDGVMVIADIPDPDSVGNYSLADRDWQIHDSILEDRVKSRVEALAHELKLPSVPWQARPDTIKDYVRQVLEFSHCSQRAQPGQWFREVVAKQSLFGHVDHFPIPANLLPKLKAHGYAVEYYDLPTPLMFASLDAALFFMYEAFALGPRVRSVVEIPDASRQVLKEQIAEHLGIQTLSAGQVSVGWRSGYFVVTRPN